MPFFGLGLHVLVAIFFAVDVIRSRRELYWLMILFAFPLLGSIVYFFAIFLPDMQSSRGVRQGIRKVANVAVNSIDPGRDLREAKAAFDFTPTAQNQWRYAEALMNDGQLEQAVAEFEQCLQGPLKTDLEIQFAAANANLRFKNGERALQLLLSIRQISKTFRPESITLLLAQSYALTGNVAAAKAEFEQAVTQFGSVQAKGEYALWAAQQGDKSLAKTLYVELCTLQKHWNKTSRALYASLMADLEKVLTIDKS